MYDPLRPVKIRKGSYLPHWTQEGANYAMNFRLADSLPSSVLQRWIFERDNIVETAVQMNRHLTDQERKRLAHLHSEVVERALDAGHGSCHLKDERIAGLVSNALLMFNGQRYQLAAWAVMPNHVHVVLRPLESYELSQILHSWKSFTAKEANKMLGRTGTFWEPEAYDHLIRDEEELSQQIDYVLQNPLKAGLVNWKWVWSDPDFTF